MAGLCELLGAGSVALGLLTPGGCAVIVGTMIVAAAPNAPSGLWAHQGGCEVPVVYAGLGTVLSKIDLFVAPKVGFVKRVGQFRQLAHFWRLRGLNARADKLTTRGDSRDLARFDRITRAFGREAGVECERRYLLALSVLTDDQFADYTTTRDGRGTARLPQGAAAGLENPRLDPEFRARLEAQIARGSSGGVAVAPGDERHAAPVVETSPEVKSAQAPASTGQADDSILDDILASETTKRAGAHAARRLVGRLALVLAAAGAGNTKAIIGLVIAGLLVVALIYFERRALAQLARAVVRRRKGAR